ncbi:antitoxin Xre/MbcA/ParS toxin-binding domain-containing protein [Mameliella alba]|uniref:antitoxin Xre/MbcA/ParS toxin-binding domain-containing protein n=1 Tax=Mameliella alba TaxID=561184 RepID=UPI001431F310|nr:antitoxin Xre/MbcA/ParS toxin-binding domain-containing protein [Mameliella alba]
MLKVSAMPKKSTPIRKKGRQSRSDLADRQLERAQGRVTADLDLKIDGAAEILELIEAWTGSHAQAVAWYDTVPLPSFGNVTAASLVRQGRADAVRAYIERIADGGHA